MKKYVLLALPLSLLFLAACNNKDDKVTNSAPAEQSTTTAEVNTESTTTTTASPFSFRNFSLDVEYGLNDSFEVDYEIEKDGVEASIEERNNKEIKGNDAYARLEPIFKAFTFTSTSTDQEIISELLKAFNLDESYKEIEVKIHFTDGTEREFKHRK